MKTHHPRRQQQSGVTLIIALILMVAMTLAAITMFRQVGTGVIVARNLTFRSAATPSSDIAVESARGFMSIAAALTLQTPSFSNVAGAEAGYFSGWCQSVVGGNIRPDSDTNGSADDCNTAFTTAYTPKNFDPFSYDWNYSFIALRNNATINGVTNSDGYEVRYVIHRMCAAEPPTPPPGGTKDYSAWCMGRMETTQSVAKDGEVTKSITFYPYYRITSRVIGPLNTVSFFQTLIY